MRIEIHDIVQDFATIKKLRAKEAEDLPLTPAECRTYQRLLEAYPFLRTNIAQEGYSKGYRD